MLHMANRSSSGHGIRAKRVIGMVGVHADLDGAVIFFLELFGDHQQHVGDGIGVTVLHFAGFVVQLADHILDADAADDMGVDGLMDQGAFEQMAIMLGSETVIRRIADRQFAADIIFLGTHLGQDTQSCRIFFRVVLRFEQTEHDRTTRCAGNGL